MNYITSIENGIYILLQLPERYVNHSCFPNAEAVDYCDIAIRDIEAGEEITVNYSKEKIPNLNLRCNRQNINCRNIIGK